MNAWQTIGFAILGYLAGALSSARLVACMARPGERLAEGTRLSLDGSDATMTLETVSATSVSVRLGSKFGFLTYVLDTLKIVIPMVLVWYFFPDQPYYLIVAMAGVIGHVWPVFHGFKGGRGLSTIYGALLVIDWPGFFVTSIGGMLFGLLAVRSVPVAYMAGPWFIIPWVWFRTHDVWILAWAIVANVVFTISAIPELRQWMKIRKEDKWNDPQEVIQLSGMGRGLLKMAKRLGVVKSAEESSSPPSPGDGRR
jgi:glycerol-3-phosphate acyltransferase PlsY